MSKDRPAWKSDNRKKSSPTVRYKIRYKIAFFHTCSLFQSRQAGSQEAPSFLLLHLLHTGPGMLAPPRGKTGFPAPPREIDKTRGAKLTALVGSFHYYKLCIRGEKRVDKYFHLTLCTDCDYLVHRSTLLKWKDIMYQNIIMHYKYLNKNLCTFVEFLDQSI